MTSRHVDIVESRRRLVKSRRRLVICQFFNISIVLKNAKVENGTHNVEVLAKSCVPEIMHSNGLWLDVCGNSTSGKSYPPREKSYPPRFAPKAPMILMVPPL